MGAEYRPWGREKDLLPAFLPLTRAPMEPVTTTKAPAIISQCGNLNIAIIDSHTVPASFCTPSPLVERRLLEPRSASIPPVNRS